MSLDFAHGAIQWLTSDTINTDLVVNGLTFRPKAIRFYWMGLQSATDAGSETVNNRRGVGFASDMSDAIVQRAIGSFAQDTAGTSNCGGVAANNGVVVTTDGAGAVDGRLSVQSIDSFGFTLNVDDVAVANLTVFWEAWGGDDIIAVTIGDIAEPAATGTQNYTATGFDTEDRNDQIVMLAGCQSTAAVNTGAATDSGFSVGFTSGTASNQNITVCGNSDDASASMDCDGWGGEGICHSAVTIAGGNLSATAVLSAFGVNLFTLNWTARATTSRRTVYMAIKGGSWRVGDLAIDNTTLNNTATVSGLPFTPKGISLLAQETNEHTGVTTSAHDVVVLGTATSTTSRRSMGIRDEDATASSACEVNIVIEYDQVVAVPNAAGAIDLSLDVNAMNSDGFQLIVDDAGATAAFWVGYLAFGNDPPDRKGPRMADPRYNTNLRM